MSDLVTKLRDRVPCGQVLGHGEYCAEGWLCSACQRRLDAAARIEELEGMMRQIIDFSDGERKIATLRELMSLDAETMAAKDRRIAELEQTEGTSGEMRRELDAKLAEVEQYAGAVADVLRLVLPMARSHATRYPVGANLEYIAQADAVLAKDPNPAGTALATEASASQRTEASGAGGAGTQCGHETCRHTFAPAATSESGERVTGRACTQCGAREERPKTETGRSDECGCSIHCHNFKSSSSQVCKGLPTLAELHQSNHQRQGADSPCAEVGSSAPSTGQPDPASQGGPSGAPSDERHGVAQSAPATHKIVPRVPTQEMIDALNDCLDDCQDSKQALILAIDAAPGNEFQVCTSTDEAVPIHPSTIEEQQGLVNAVERVWFRAGLIAAREYMARFVEVQDAGIAQSIRANWWPCLGPDFGPPRKLDFAELTEGEYGEPGFKVKEELSPTLEALPIAAGFLNSQGPDADVRHAIFSSKDGERG